MDWWNKYIGGGGGCRCYRLLTRTAQHSTMRQLVASGYALRYVSRLLFARSLARSLLVRYSVDIFRRLPKGVSSLPSVLPSSKMAKQHATATAGRLCCTFAGSNATSRRSQVPSQLLTDLPVASSIHNFFLDSTMKRKGNCRMTIGSFVPRRFFFQILLCCCVAERRLVVAVAVEINAKQIIIRGGSSRRRRDEDLFGSSASVQNY